MPFPPSPDAGLGAGTPCGVGNYRRSVLDEVVRTPYLRRAPLQGYDRREVDDLLARVAMDLEAGRPPAATIAGAGLHREPWGYEPRDVDWLLDRLRAVGTPQAATPPEHWPRALALHALVVVSVAALVGGLLGAAVLATMLALLFGVGVPLLAKRSYRTLVFRLRVDPSVRTRFLVSSIVTKWTYVAVVALVGVFAGVGPAAIGLALGHGSPTGRLVTIEVIVVVLATSVPTVLRLQRASPGSLPRARRQLEGAIALLPRTRAERRLFAAVAVTAGITEEIIYRGFGIAYVRWLHPGIGGLAIVVVTSAAFGLAHTYQGRRGVLLTAAIGAVLGWLTLISGSLLPAIALHTLLDLRLLALPAWLLEDAEPSAEATG